MKKVNAVNQVLSLILTAGLGILKTVADMRRHDKHEDHDQRCNCLHGCFRCAWEAAVRGR